MQYTGGHVRHIHQRFCHDGAVRLAYTLAQRFCHLGRCIADIDLTTSDVMRPPIKRNAAGQARHRVLADGIGGGVDPRHRSRDRAVVDNPPALGVLAFHLPKRPAGTKISTMYVGVQHCLPLG